MTRLFSQGYYRVPSPFDACPRPIIVSLVNLAPFSQRFAFAVDSNKQSRSSVSSLCFDRSPSAIFRRIALIIIDAFERCAYRWITCIYKETFKRLSPLRTHINTPSAVESKRFMGWIIATLKHGPIGVICAHVARWQLTITTLTTSLTLTRSQRVRLDGFEHTTHTFTFPQKGVVAAFASQTNNAPTSELLSRQIVRWSRLIAIFGGVSVRHGSLYYECEVLS